MASKKVLVVTNIAPLYRSALWAELLSNDLNEFHFYFDSRPYQGISQIDFCKSQLGIHEAKLHYLKNFYIRNRWMIWQSGIIPKLLSESFDVAIFLGDSVCLSTWVAAIICKLRKKRLVLWGHGFYGNESVIKLFIRKIFYRLADQHLLYERRGKFLMMEKGFDAANLYVIFNSLDYDTHLKIRDSHINADKSKVFPFFKNPCLPVIIFVGRLTKEKNLELLIDAAKFINIDNAKFNLLIIGGGSFFDELKQKAKAGIENEWVYFFGPLYEESRLGEYIAISDLCVSPGNVGLTAVHSLALGTPVCTHGNLDNQMPEAESIRQGYNGFYFEEHNIESLVNGIENWFGSGVDRNLIRSRCYEVVDKFYNPYYQLTVIDRAINQLPPEL